MEYIYGTTERGGVMVENLKTVGEMCIRDRFNAAFNDWRFAAVGGVSSGQELPD